MDSIFGPDSSDSGPPPRKRPRVLDEFDCYRLTPNYVIARLAGACGRAFSDEDFGFEASANHENAKAKGKGAAVLLDSFLTSNDHCGRECGYHLEAKVEEAQRRRDDDASGGVDEDLQIHIIIQRDERDDRDGRPPPKLERIAIALEDVDAPENRDEIDAPAPADPKKEAAVESSSPRLAGVAPEPSLKKTSSRPRQFWLPTFILDVDPDGDFFLLGGQEHFERPEQKQELKRDSDTTRVSASPVLVGGGRWRYFVFRLDRLQSMLRLAGEVLARRHGDTGGCGEEDFVRDRIAGADELVKQGIVRRRRQQGRDITVGDTEDVLDVVIVDSSDRLLLYSLVTSPATAPARSCSQGTFLLPEQQYRRAQRVLGTGRKEGAQWSLLVEHQRHHAVVVRVDMDGSSPPGAHLLEDLLCPGIASLCEARGPGFRGLHFNDAFVALLEENTGARGVDAAGTAGANDRACLVSIFPFFPALENRGEIRVAATGCIRVEAHHGSRHDSQHLFARSATTATSGDAAHDLAAALGDHGHDHGEQIVKTNDHQDLLRTSLLAALVDRAEADRVKNLPVLLNRDSLMCQSISTGSGAPGAEAVGETNSKKKSWLTLSVNQDVAVVERRKPAPDGQGADEADGRLLPNGMNRTALLEFLNRMEE